MLFAMWQQLQTHVVMDLLLTTDWTPLTRKSYPVETEFRPVNNLTSNQWWVQDEILGMADTISLI